MYICTSYILCARGYIQGCLSALFTCLCMCQKVYPRVKTCACYFCLYMFGDMLTRNALSLPVLCEWNPPDLVYTHNKGPVNMELWQFPFVSSNKLLNKKWICSVWDTMLLVYHPGNGYVEGRLPMPDIFLYLWLYAREITCIYHVFVLGGICKRDYLCSPCFCVGQYMQGRLPVPTIFLCWAVYAREITCAHNVFVWGGICKGDDLCPPSFCVRQYMPGRLPLPIMFLC